MDASSWAHKGRQELGRVLLAAGGASLTAADLAAATGRDPSNTRRTAEAMVREGLLEPREAPRSGAAAGRPASAAYVLAPGQAEALEQAPSVGVGQLAVGQQLVFAEATAEQLDDLFHVLGSTPAAARASWCALADGDRQEYVVVLDGEGAAAAAVDLMGVLAAAEVRCRRSTIAEIVPASQLVRRARSVARAAQAVRLRRATRRTEHAESADERRA